MQHQYKPYRPIYNSILSAETKVSRIEWALLYTIIILTLIANVYFVYSLARAINIYMQQIVQPAFAHDYNLHVVIFFSVMTVYTALIQCLCLVSYMAKVRR